MDEQNTSWIRRTKFSHTVCHPLDYSRLNTLQFAVPPNRTAPRVQSTHPSPDQTQNLPTTSRQRAVTPNPEIKLSETFKEARSSQRRFSTPTPTLRRKSSSVTRTKSPKSLNEPKSLKSPSPLKYIASMIQKESAWSKYFDHIGGRVTSVETADDHMVDLSKLLLGNKFAHGAHSRLYHGFYMDEPVAMKMIIVPDDDENGVGLGLRLEQQFVREVTLLSKLRHENLIKNLRPVVPRDCAPAMKELIEQCWSLQPDKRPEFWQIVKVLEEFKSSLALNGTLNLVQNPTFQDPKKGLLHWIQKLGNQNTSSMPKPKLA